MKAGDVLILVRRRDPFTTPMIRALKREGVPVAGADRMKLMDQLAVQDLVALADVLLMPEDDLALAVVLKSPLFGLDDDALFDLAYEREPRSLWSALKEKSREDARFAEAYQRLSAWLGRADLLPPYEFFSELLGADGQMMRERMLVRLGPEAAEAIDEFLDLALAYDREAAPSLQGFIDQLRGGDIEIKRDMEQGRDEVRIMTVHGAKGLQAPIVFLPDTCMNVRPQGVRLFPLPRPGEPPGGGRPSHLGRRPTYRPRGDRRAQGEAEAGGPRGVSPAALCGDDAGARPALCLRLAGPARRAREGLVVSRLIDDGLGGLLAEIPTSDGVSVRRMECAQEKPIKNDEPSRRESLCRRFPTGRVRPPRPERARRKLTPSRLALSPVEGAEAPFAFQPPLGPRALSANHRIRPRAAGACPAPASAGDRT